MTEMCQSIVCTDRFLSVTAATKQVTIAKRGMIGTFISCFSVFSRFVSLLQLDPEVNNAIIISIISDDKFFEMDICP